MTDKQIIIDGVDVSGCKYIDIENFEPPICHCVSQRDECEMPCEDNKDCHYKQLKRKEQELQKAMDNYVQLDLQRVKEYNELVDLYKYKEQECDELKREKRNFYNFLTNKYNYGSFRPMWGTYLLRRFFKEDLGDFFDEKSYEMVDTLEEKEKQLDQLKAENEKLEQTLAEIKEIVEQQCNICEELTHIDEYKDCKKCWQGKILQKISESEVG